MNNQLSPWSTQSFTVYTAPTLIYKKTSNLRLEYTPTLGDNGLLFSMVRWNNDASYGLAAFDPSNGSVVWGPVIPPGCTNFGTAVVTVGANGLVYAVSDWNECGLGKVIAFDANNGSIVRDYGGIPASPHPRSIALDDQLDRLYSGSQCLYSFDMGSTNNYWSQCRGYYIGDSMAIDSSGNIYHGTYNATSGRDFNIMSYGSDGSFRWLHDFQDVFPYGYGIKAILAGDIIIIGGGSPDTLHAWDKNGNELWQVVNLTNPVTDETGIIYASSITGNDVVSLAPNGNELWRRTLTDATWAKVDFIDNAGHIYVRGNSKLYVINSTDGSIAWSFSADADLNIGAVLTPGGHIFLSDNNATFYLLDTSGIDYAPSAWPIVQYGNYRHTQKTGDILALPDETPTIIRLSSFTVRPSLGAVKLLWVTESETENAGFNLYRSETKDGKYAKINSSLIPAKGSSTQGASYEFVDSNVKNRKTYFYKLEDIDLSGKSAMHGPIKAKVKRLIGEWVNR